MDNRNHSVVTRFVFMSFSEFLEVQVSLFFLMLVLYLISLVGNVVIITITVVDPALGYPLYFFLRNLSFLEIGYTSSAIPEMLVNFLSKDKSISFLGCAMQMYFFTFLGITECCLLAIMAYDRYVTICHPLRYRTMMSRMVLAWLGGLAHSAVQIGLLLQLPFCGPNVLDNFYCDVPQVIKLACTKTHLVELQVVFNGGVLLVMIFIILLISYAIILFKIRTYLTEGKHEALSTCGTQITVVCLIFTPCIFIYARPFQKFTLDKVVSVIYTVITPMLNPMIYMLRNAEMKKAIRRLMRRVLCSKREINT
uniref:Olfactory receptor n=1 Tax=Gopherus evgoodei TaxID=1825980 RepID=A0A8C4Y7Y4_9SAUR